MPANRILGDLVCIYNEFKSTMSPKPGIVLTPLEWRKKKSAYSNVGDIGGWGDRERKTKQGK